MNVYIDHNNEDHLSRWVYTIRELNEEENKIMDWKGLRVAKTYCQQKGWNVMFVIGSSKSHTIKEKGQKF